MAAGAHFAAHHGDHVPDFGGDAVGAHEHLAVENHAAAYAGAQGDEHGIAHIGAHARDGLRETGHGGVVVYKHRLVNFLLNQLHQGHVVPAQVGAEGNAAGAGILNAGDADAHGMHFVQGMAALPKRLQGDLGHIVYHGLMTAVLVRGAAAFVQNRAVFIHYAGLDTGAAYVNTDIEHMLVLRYT